MRRSHVIPASLTFVTLACASTPAQDAGTAPPQQHVVASPNPTIDDSKSPAAVEPVQLKVTKVKPVQGTTAAPMKTTGPKRKRTKPRND